MEKKKKIAVTEDDGIYRVSAEFEHGFHLVPSPMGKMQLAFWDERRLKVFLRNFGFAPDIRHSNN
jgi:hypothetical protein